MKTIKQRIYRLTNKTSGLSLLDSISWSTGDFFTLFDVDAEIDQYIKETLQAIMNDEEQTALKLELTAYLLSGNND